MAPFRGIFEPIELTDSSTLDISILFAMIVYGFVALGLSALLDWMTNKLQQSQLHDRAAAPMLSATSRLVNLSGPGGASASAT